MTSLSLVADNGSTKPVLSYRGAEALFKALHGGVVPVVGQHLIQVGRKRELEAMLSDVDAVAAGGASFRVVIGDYGAGKSFFLGLVRSMALERKLVATRADLTPDRRLHASGGQARSLYAELMRNLATRAKPEGGAMKAIVDKFVMSAKEEAAAVSKPVDSVIRARLASLSELVNGYDFADVIAAYCRAHDTDNEELMASAIRWLRGEYTTRTDAKAALGVRTIVDDANVYDMLKLMGKFVRLAGYSGLLVCLDELVNLYKMANAQARNANYEQILRIFNDMLQGNTEGLGFVLGGTPDFLFDARRGLYSYPALQTRLAQNSFATPDRVDYSGPVVRLAALTAEEFFVLLQKVRLVHARGDETKIALPDDGIRAFMAHCAKRLGEASFKTPRFLIKDFSGLLSLLGQYPDMRWQDSIDAIVLSVDPEAAQPQSPASTTVAPTANADDELVSFRL